MTETVGLNIPAILELHEKMRPCEKPFETVMVDTVDEVFSSLGPSCRQAIYFQLEKKFRIRRNEIALKITDFAYAIEQIFGGGAKFIELKIIEALHGKIPGFMYFPKTEDIVFAEYVASLNRFFMITNLSSANTVPLLRT